VKKEVLQRGKRKEEGGILQITRRGNVEMIDYILRTNCLLKHVIEGKIHERVEVTGRRGIRSKQLLNDF
jgi:hypothetical protein